MQTVINISNIDVILESNAFTPIKYRQLFDSDILIELQHLNEDNLDVECIMKLGYCMALQGGETLSFEQWLSQFELDDFYQAMPDIITTWAKNAKQTSKPKKAPGK